MKYTVKPSTIFQKDLKRVEKRGYHLALLAEVIKMLTNDEELPTKYRDHHNNLHTTIITLDHVKQPEYIPF